MALHPQFKKAVRAVREPYLSEPETLDKTLRQISPAIPRGVSRRHALTLLIGLAAIQRWLKDPEREQAYEEAFGATERARKRKRYDEQEFDRLSAERSALSKRAVDRLETETCVGFALACGLEKHSWKAWRPLAEALHSALRGQPSLGDAIEPIMSRFENVRVRIERVKAKDEVDDLYARGAATFQELETLIFRSGVRRRIDAPGLYQK